MKHKVVTEVGKAIIDTMAVRLYCHDLHEGPCQLEAEESHHGKNVLRLRRDDAVYLFDGKGRVGAGIVSETRRRMLVVTVESVEQRPFDLARKLTIAVAMPRAHRQGTLIEKCTELGVARIIPLLSERSVSRPDSDAAAKLFRRAIEAARQCERAWIPRVHAPMTLAESITGIGEFDGAAIAHPDGECVSWPQYLSGLGRTASVLLWVGPEGGWTDAEIVLCEQAGATRVLLSPTVLRTETAAVAACAVAAALECETGRNTRARQDHA